MADWGALMSYSGTVRAAIDRAYPGATDCTDPDCAGGTA
jgi:hypothetical protein